VLLTVLCQTVQHSSTRLKKYPIISFLTVFFFQGAFIYYTPIRRLRIKLIQHWDIDFIVAGAICSCLIGASYPLTQVYQHAEDSRRGDRTLVCCWVIKALFIFSGNVIRPGDCTILYYWRMQGMMLNFYFFSALRPAYIFIL